MNRYVGPCVGLCALCALIAAGLLGTGVGCGDNDGSASAGSAGSGGSQGNPTDARLLPFLGKWVVKSGENTFQCEGQPPMTRAATGEFEVVAAGDGRIETVPSAGCRIAYTVNGSTATAVAGQSCSDQADGSTTVTELVRGSLVTTDGKTAKLDGEYKTTATLTPGGAKVSCTLSGSAQLSRVE
jgi:hypothetical protein